MPVPGEPGDWPAGIPGVVAGAGDVPERPPVPLVPLVLGMPVEPGVPGMPGMPPEEDEELVGVVTQALASSASAQPSVSPRRIRPIRSKCLLFISVSLVSQDRCISA
jgi:hypothetical protein